MSNPKKLAAKYNMAINLFWSMLSLGPLVVFCYQWMDVPLLLLFTGLSIIPVVLPASLLHKLQIANSPGTYQKLGIGLVQALSQNGQFINSMIRKKHQGYRMVRFHRRSIESLLQQTYVFEKFHLVCFIFFSLSCLYAIRQGLHLWAISIAVTNLFYNIYPILLQQYIRTKLAAYRLKGKDERPFQKNCLPAGLNG